MTSLQIIIEEAFENRSEISPSNVDKKVKDAIEEVLDGLNNGKLRVATRIDDSQQWETHQWLKKAVLLSFRVQDNFVMPSRYTNFFDKVDDFTGNSFLENLSKNS